MNLNLVDPLTVSTQVGQIMLAMGAAETPAEMLLAAINGVRDLLGLDFALTLVDVPGGEDHYFLGHVSPQQWEWEPLVSSWLTAVTQSGHTLHPGLVSPNGRVPAQAGGVSAWVATPILGKQKVIGVLAACNIARSHAFTPAEIVLLETFARQIAISLNHYHLRHLQRQQSARLEERNRQMGAFSQAVVNIAGELTLDKVLQQIVDSARVLIRAEYAALGVPNADNVLETFVHSGLTQQQVEQIPHSPHGLGLLGAIIREKRPIRVPSISHDPRSVGFPDAHPPMYTFLGVPIQAAGEILGHLYLTDKIGATEFTTDDQKLAELLAAHAAVSIQNARLYEQVGRLVVVEERTRIGMDLHDGIIQSIYAAGLTLESVRLALGDNHWEDADRLLDYAIDGLNNTIRDIRNFILDLRPHRFKGDLQEGLARLVREFQVNTMVPVMLDAPPASLTELRTPLARTLFLTTQEALANVARHARARQVHVSVHVTDTTVWLRIADDGRGFDMQKQTRAVGHGLSNMRTRAEELKGTFKLDSAPGQGTTITVALPREIGVSTAK